jgi:hypothetical protein
MREVSAHAQNDDRSVAAEIFAVGTYFPNTPRIIKQNQGNVLGPHYNKVYECYISIMTFIYYVKMRVTNVKKYC